MNTFLHENGNFELIPLILLMTLSLLPKCQILFLVKLRFNLIMMSIVEYTVLITRNLTILQAYSSLKVGEVISTLIACVLLTLFILESIKVYEVVNHKYMLKEKYEE